MPSLPLKYQDVTSSSSNDFNLSNLSERITESEAQRQQAFDLSRKIQVLLTSARKHVGEPDSMNSLRSIAEDKHDAALLFSPPDDPRRPRLANLSNRMEDIARVEAFNHFILTGTLIAPSTLSSLYTCTDEEYLAGAMMGLGNDLKRYALGRATVRDVASVEAASALVADCQDFLLQLDFRNGPLRRRFDGNKYNLKALETLLYELAITGGDGSKKENDGAEPQSKKSKQEGSEETPSLIPKEELQALKERMDYRDELRENLIKLCRDSQKAAKQSIFALHRGDKARSTQLLLECQTHIQTKLLPIVDKESTLRLSGSFTAVLEEYVEARLFATWLHGKDVLETSTTGTYGPENPAGILLKPEDFVEFTLEPEEYLGGLCDLTGEIGRYAVQRGTVRDVASVRLCLQTNDAIMNVLNLIRYPSGSSVGKKGDAVRMSVEKLERMLYEMSLSEATGRHSVHTNVDDDQEAPAES